MAAANRWRGVPDRLMLRDADKMEAEAEELLTPELPAEVSAGEAVPDISGDNTVQRMKRIDIRDTLRNPGQVARDASAERTELLLSDSVDVTALALDVADTIEAENSLEKMLSHQLALAHKASFQIADKALMLSDRVHGCTNAEAVRIYSTESARLMNASARMMQSFQQGMATLQKVRTGGSQTMTVQHVHVSDGGQALIGNVSDGGRKRGEKEK